MNKFAFLPLSLMVAVSFFVCLRADGELSRREKVQRLRPHVPQIGANLPKNAVDTKGDTVLHRIALKCHYDEEASKFIKEHGVPNPLIKNNKGETARDIAESNKCNASLRQLLNGLTAGYEIGAIEGMLENDNSAKDSQ